MAEKDDKKRALDLALSQIEKQYGKGAIMRLGGAEPRWIFRRFRPDPSDSTSPWGSAGFPADGSSRSLARSPRARRRWPCTWWRKHRRLVAPLPLSMPNTRWIWLCPKLGVQVDDLLVSQPDSGEQALEITETLVRSGAIDVIVVDSVAALSREPRSKAKWAMRIWGCRRGSCARRFAN